MRVPDGRTTRPPHPAMLAQGDESRRGEVASGIVITYDGAATINRSAEEVFVFASAPVNLPKWSDVSDVQKLTDGPMGLGSRVRLAMGQKPMRAIAEFEISEWEENRAWTWKTVPPLWIIWDASYRIEPLGPSSCRITTEGQITLNGMRRVLEPMVRREVAKREQDELDLLRELLDGTPISRD